MVYIFTETCYLGVLGFNKVTKKVISFCTIFLYVSFLLFCRKQLIFTELTLQKVYSLLLLLAYSDVLCYYYLILTILSHSLHFLLLFLVFYNFLHHTHFWSDVSLCPDSVSKFDYLTMHFIFELLTVCDYFLFDFHFSSPLLFPRLNLALQCFIFHL